MNINTAEYVVSSPAVERCPETDLWEYAFIGRSNVGKSSLINMLCGRKALAKTGATPGKTLLINHFLINRAWHLVDLPGYGYAKRSKAEQKRLREMIEGYVLRREQLACLFVLIDSRHEPQRIDLEFVEWLGENGIPFALVFTKADKTTRNAVAHNVKLFRQRLREQWDELPPHFVTSSETRQGRDELLGYIDEVNRQIMT